MVYGKIENAQQVKGTLAKGRYALADQPPKGFCANRFEGAMLEFGNYASVTKTLSQEEVRHPFSHVYSDYYPNSLF